MTEEGRPKSHKKRHTKTNALDPKVPANVPVNDLGEIDETAELAEDDAAELDGLDADSIMKAERFKISASAPIHGVDSVPLGTADGVSGWEETARILKRKGKLDTQTILYFLDGETKLELGNVDASFVTDGKKFYDYVMRNFALPGAARMLQWRSTVNGLQYRVGRLRIGPKPEEQHPPQPPPGAPPQAPYGYPQPPPGYPPPAWGATQYPWQAPPAGTPAAYPPPPPPAPPAGAPAVPPMPAGLSPETVAIIDAYRKQVDYLTQLVTQHGQQPPPPPGYGPPPPLAPVVAAPTAPPAPPPTPREAMAGALELLGDLKQGLAKLEAMTTTPGGAATAAAAAATTTAAPGPPVTKIGGVTEDDLSIIVDNKTGETKWDQTLVLGLGVLSNRLENLIDKAKNAQLEIIQARKTVTTTGTATEQQQAPPPAPGARKLDGMF